MTLNAKNIMILTTGLLLFACGKEETSSSKGQSSITCNFVINGKAVQGNNQKECDRLKNSENLGIPKKKADSDNKLPCRFVINSQIRQGYSAAECSALAKAYKASIGKP